MEVFLVGGAVRDELLGRPVRERDWVVVGSSPEELLALGYQQVGRDFPVFLHPGSKDEYALARTERKSGPGHKGFVVHAGPEVTLEEDLRRRDLTVNAIARSEDGELIDPFAGQADLRARALRHVSPAFSEDPLRVFRVARFAAQLDGFGVADETQKLMQAMSRDGALDELSAERVWTELCKALDAPSPLRFFDVLRRADCLKPWLAELATVSLTLPDALAGAEQRYAALGYALGVSAVEALSARLKAPNAYARLALLTARYADVLTAWSAGTETARALYEALAATRAFRRENESELPGLLKVVEALKGVDLASLTACVKACNARITTQAFLDEGLQGPELGAALEAARVEFLATAQKR